jgi:hypothetical protein
LKGLGKTVIELEERVAHIETVLAAVRGRLQAKEREVAVLERELQLAQARCLSHLSSIHSAE